ncbi:hypothetical protein, partial [Dyadobacter bucti]|uniref:hypothetical protein n=1 Tax=Dyadobacter bucti TaxID=2572203 RepID=UPI00197A806D
MSINSIHYYACLSWTFVITTSTDVVPFWFTLLRVSKYLKTSILIQFVGNIRLQKLLDLNSSK